MFDVLCITNRLLCREDFLTRIEKIASAHPKAIVLREKDLSEAEYKKLAVEVIEICKKYNTACILHSFSNVAAELRFSSLHLPLKILRTLTEDEKNKYKTLGTSCHSVEEAAEAESLGCTYIIAGHIFETDCKKGMPGRGLEFLKEVCNSVSIPVYAIGGINEENVVQIKNVGASGACVMSSVMICDNVQEYIGDLK